MVQLGETRCAPARCLGNKIFFSRNNTKTKDDKLVPTAAMSFAQHKIRDTPKYSVYTIYEPNILTFFPLFNSF